MLTATPTGQNTTAQSIALSSESENESRACPARSPTQARQSCVLCLAVLILFFVTVIDLIESGDITDGWVKFDVSLVSRFLDPR